MEEKQRCISKKEFGEDRTNVGYALYVRNNIKEEDYMRCNTGDIYRVVGSKGNRVYYIWGEHYWVDISAITNFKEDITDLIEVGDIVHTKDVLNEDYYYMFDKEMVQATRETIQDGIKLVDILTHEQYNANCYRLEV